MVHAHGELLANINFWAFSVFLKLIPCILLTCLSLALIRILIEARKRKERLLGGGTSRSQALNHSQKAAQTHHHHRNQNNQPPATTTTIIQTATPILGTAHLHRRSSSSASLKQNKNDYQEDSPATAAVAIAGATESGTVIATNQLFLEIAETNPNNSSTSDFNKPRSLLSRALSLFHYPLALFTSDSDRTATGDRIQLKLRKSRAATTAATATGNHNNSPNNHHHHHLQHYHHHHHHHHHHSSPVPPPQPPSTRQQASSAGNSERTTRMLIAVLIVFLVCEFPSGVLALLSAIKGKAFFDNIYLNFGEMMDMLALINSAVNFILYCFMSQQFRKTFSQLFCICWWTEEVAGGPGAGAAGGAGVGGPISAFVRDPQPPPPAALLPSTKVLNISQKVVTSASALPVATVATTNDQAQNSLPRSSSQQHQIGEKSSQPDPVPVTAVMKLPDSCFSTTKEPETNSVLLNNNFVLSSITANPNALSLSNIPVFKNQPQPSDITHSTKPYENDKPNNATAAVQV